MNKTFLIRFTIFFLWTLSGCLSRNEVISKSEEDQFKVQFPIVDMNKSLQLKVNSNSNVFQANAKIPLVFNNMSSHSIFFQPDSFLKLLVIQDDEWQEITNKYSYSGSLQISPKGTLLLDTRHVVVEPILDDQLSKVSKNELTLVRVLIKGEILESDVHTGKFVGAFVDVFIEAT